MKEGFRDYTENVKQDIDSALRLALTEAAIQLEGEIAIRTPVDTGRLRASISHIAPLGKSQEGGDRISGIRDEHAAFVGTNVSYASYVEYGTKRMRAQPYMRTGFNAAKDDIRRIIGRRMSVDMGHRT